MMVPIRCFSCGTLIADRWDECRSLVDGGKTLEEALDIVKISRYCCRRMFISHVELVDDVAPFSITHE